MPKIKANGIEIEYDCFGNADAQAVLLISGKRLGGHILNGG
jgi:hypothetical protein